MRDTVGYLDDLDLGIDEKTGQKNLVVLSAREFAELSELEQKNAWVTASVASEILNSSLTNVYYKVYREKVPSKIIKKKASDRHGLTLVKIHRALQDTVTKRENAEERLKKSLRNSLKAVKWLPAKQRDLMVIQIFIHLRELERTLTAVNNNNKE